MGCTDSREDMPKEEIASPSAPDAPQVSHRDARNACKLFPIFIPRTPLKVTNSIAVTELMKPKAPPLQVPKGKSNPYKTDAARNGLGVYIAQPLAFAGKPDNPVIFHNENFVAVRDKYPKASVHTLLLPCSSVHSLQHPFVAFEDLEFLAAVRTEATRLKTLVAKELQRKFGSFSESEQQREAALAAGSAGAEAPAGRDWEAEVRVGVHACPSMNHLHVHVFSRDMHSPALKHRKHYNSFNTPFLVDLADFPLAADDPRRDPARQKYFNQNFRCWRCGKDFGNQFKALKEHLEEEFQAWTKE